MNRRRFGRLCMASSMAPFLSGGAPAGKLRPGGKPARLVDAANTPGTLFGIQYENWFVPGQADWQTTEAIPILGRYSSLDLGVIRKHFRWFEWLGIDWLLIDWSNMLWAKPAWEEHTGGSLALERSVALLFRICSELEQQGKYAPKLVFMVGLQNGPPVPDAMVRLNRITSWLKHNYLDRPEYKGQWLYYSGKPLLTVLYWPRDPCAQIETDLRHTALDAPDWTVRWMSTQLQDNHAEACGMWSWMDGSIRQKVTLHDGAPEETVVTPACFPFPARGWLDPGAVGRDHGVPYLESWKVAFENRPKFVQIHQWNEFAGQKDGQGFPVDYWGESGKPAQSSKDVFGDEFNVNLSDDIEPTRTSGCGYRECGGWGYYYLNLTKALISLYRRETPDITVLALSQPQIAAGSKSQELHLTWNFVGRQPSGFTVLLDGRTISAGIQSIGYLLKLAGVSSGKHRITVIAEGAHTYYDLSEDRMSMRSKQPQRAQSSIEVKIS